MVTVQTSGQPSFPDDPVSWPAILESLLEGPLCLNGLAVPTLVMMEWAAELPLFSNSRSILPRNIQMLHGGCPPEALTKCAAVKSGT